MRLTSTVPFNRLFLAVLPILALAAGLDLVRWNAHFQEEAAPLKPGLEDLMRVPAPIPLLTLSAVLFQPPVAVAVSSTSSAPVMRDVQWKLKGVLMGATHRAFLEDSEGKTLWVTERESLDPTTQVKEIRARSVLLEKGGKTYEIQM